VVDLVGGAVAEAVEEDLGVRQVKLRTGEVTSKQDEEESEGESPELTEEELKKRYTRGIGLRKKKKVDYTELTDEEIERKKLEEQRIMGDEPEAEAEAEEELVDLSLAFDTTLLPSPKITFVPPPKKKVPVKGLVLSAELLPKFAQTSVEAILITEEPPSRSPTPPPSLPIRAPTPELEAPQIKREPTPEPPEPQTYDPFVPLRFEFARREVEQLERKLYHHHPLARPIVSRRPAPYWPDQLLTALDEDGGGGGAMGAIGGALVLILLAFSMPRHETGSY
jgi:hypothetical protein